MSENIMKPSEWELDNVVAIDRNDEPWDEGEQVIKILEVTYNPETMEKFANTYTITAEPLEGDGVGTAVGRFRFWLTANDGSRNDVQIRIMNSLWCSIYGKTDTVGIPKPSDAEGCVVVAKVGYYKDYLQISNFKPAPQSFAMFSDKMNSQYFAIEE